LEEKSGAAPKRKRDKPAEANGLPREDVVRRHMMPIYNALGYLTRRLEQRITQEYEVHGDKPKLTRAQFVVLSAAVLIPEMEQAELALVVGYDRATTGVVVAKLESLGLISRARSDRSRRGWLVKATPTGEKIIEGQLGKLEAIQGAILAPLEEAERLTLLHLLSKLLGVRNSYNMG